MTTHIKEADIQRDILVFLSYRRLFHWRQNSGAMPIGTGAGRRFVSFGTAGAPDIFVVKDGQIHGIEVKTAVGRQNDNQKEFQRGFEAAGGKYHLVRTLAEVMKLF